MLDLQGGLRPEHTRRWVTDTCRDIHFSAQMLHPAQRTLPGRLFRSIPCPRNQLPPPASGNSQAKLPQPTTYDGFYQPSGGQAIWLERHAYLPCVSMCLQHLSTIRGTCQVMGLRLNIFFLPRLLRASSSWGCDNCSASSSLEALSLRSVMESTDIAP